MPRAGLCVVWALMLFSGFIALAGYQARPGDPGSARSSWPGGLGVSPDAERPTLLVFLHPRCPCSRATTEELAAIPGLVGGDFAGRVIAYRPDPPSEGWGAPGGVPPGFAWVEDPGGRLAAGFGVATSGHILLYAPSGRLLFSGGITPSRGHRGANRGLDALLARIDRAGDGPGRSPVFGCPVIRPR